MNDAHLVIDLGFGDAGKGATVDALVEWTGAGTVVRFNGGAQAGHNVVLADGRHHTFAQLGAATFVPGVRTLLSRDVVVHPTGLIAELEHLAMKGVRDAIERLDVDVDAVVSTPYHQVAGRIRELARGAGRHGSCGVGHGEAVAWSLSRPETTLRVADLHDARVVRRCLEAHREGALALPEVDAPALEELLRDDASLENAVTLFTHLGRRLSRVDGTEALRRALRRSSVVFEGAQGVLLDERHGFHPHTTWSTTTAKNAHALLDSAGFSGRRVVLGVTRTYGVRHGAGPFPTEDPAFGGTEPHNASDHPWQGAFRRGLLDAVLLRYAVAAAGPVDSLVVTHCDNAPADWAGAWELGPEWSERGGHRLDARLVLEGDRVKALLPLEVPDLVAQAHLGAALSAVKPVKQPIPSPEALAEQLGLTLACVSDGPRRTDRRWTGVGL